jgi:hypothetical protein
MTTAQTLSNLEWTSRQTGNATVVEMNGHQIELKFVRRYHHSAQGLMLNSQWSLDGKRIGFAKLVKALS